MTKPKKELTIETLEVEIRVIRVGGHKMTISVFNQLNQINLREFLQLEVLPANKGEMASKLKKKLAGDDSATVLGYVISKDAEYLVVSNSSQIFKVYYYSYPNDGWQPMDANIEARNWIKANLNQLFIGT